MKKIFYFICLSVLFVSCKTDKEKQLEKFVEGIENAGLGNFINLEYFTRDEIEFYNYYKGDSIFTTWQFDKRSKEFGQFDKVRLNSLSGNSLKYMDSLRNDIQFAGVKLIGQTEWKSQVVFFWLTDTEYVTYVQPDFKFDSPSKLLLEKELKSLLKIKDNWYYTRLRVCKNK